MSESKGQHQDYIDNLFKDAKLAQEEAEVHKDTKVINFKPKFTEDFSQEDLDKAVAFINRQGAIVSTATSNIGYDNYKEGKAEHWTGVLDLGSIKVMTESHLRETYEMGQDKKEVEYGITDLCFDFTYDEPLSAYFDHFAELDNARCKALFDD